MVYLSISFNRLFSLRKLKKILEDTARYVGLLLAPAEGFGLRPRAVFALWAKKGLIMLFWHIFGNFLFPVVRELLQKKIPHTGDKASLDRCG